MPTLSELAHALLTLPLSTLAIAILVSLIIPVFLHVVVFRVSGLTTLPSILILGPSGSGKTALLTLLERGTTAATHTSQTPIAVECSLPLGRSTGSDKYRSTNDPANITHKKFLLIDTPGHGKLRHHAVGNITGPQNLKGIIFLIDAATLSTENEGLRQAAEYLHDVLLLLQKRKVSGKSSKFLKEIPVLIAANKMDLFTALPAALAKSSLESEITKIRVSRARGLLDSGISMGDGAEDEKDDWLGEMGSTAFTFSQMEEFDIPVEVAGGTVLGGDSQNIDKWWKWISEKI